MSANLTPQYRKAEQAYRQASGPEEELECLQLMLREIPKHKGTDRLQSDLKQKISKLKKEDSKGKPGGQKGSRRIPRQGAGRAVLLGPPNSGKSQLLESLTRAKPEIAHYPFTTSAPMPGMMPFEDVQVQLIDTPPVTSDFLDPTTQGLVRGADLVLLLIGYEMDTDFLESIGVELVGENRAPKLDHQTMQTNVPGLFVAGTAAAGTQLRFHLFIENCHPHVDKIIRAITGQEAPFATSDKTHSGKYALPET